VAGAASRAGAADLHDRPGAGLRKHRAGLPGRMDRRRRLAAIAGLSRAEKGLNSGRGKAMRITLPILLSAALLAAAILVTFHDELHARGPHRLTECGFWGDMAAGMSCR